jgi:hypothetical protein
LRIYLSLTDILQNSSSIGIFYSNSCGIGKDILERINKDVCDGYHNRKNVDLLTSFDSNGFFTPSGDF